MGLTTEPHTKGAAFRAFFEWCRNEYGEAAGLSVYRAASPEHRRLLDPKDSHWGIVVSSWYPDSLVNRLLEAQFDPLGESERESALRRATFYAADKTLNGIYRQFVKMIMTPALYTRHVQRLWSLYYDTGTVSGAYSEGQIDFTIVGWRGHHPLRCRITEFSSAQAFTMMGCKSVRLVCTRCVSNGAPSCDYTVTWDAR